MTDYLTEEFLLAESPTTGYSPQDLANLYHFPSNLGEGQTIGILSLGGKFDDNDLSLFCKKYNIKKPNVTIIGQEPVLNQEKQVFADLETNLDIQMTVGSAPKEDNLYLAFFQNPNKTRSVNQLYSYSVSYITAAELDACELSPENLPDNHTPDEIESIESHLGTYYGDTQVQSGGLNPMDLQSSPSNTACMACYVANLRTFTS